MLNSLDHHNFDNSYFSNRIIRDRDYVLAYTSNQILLIQRNGEFELPRKEDLINDLPTSRFIYLFSMDNTNCFLSLDIPNINTVFVWEDIYNIRTLLNKESRWLGALGNHLYSWYRANNYCGVCGSPTFLKTEERAIQCTGCDQTIYPKISPAVIVAITDGDKILLAQAVNFRTKFYSLIAGYVDVGESLEQTLVREVKEEVGIEISNVRYYKSQPWPFSGSLMLGFFANADHQQVLKIDEKELLTAAWFTRGNLPTTPSNISIAGEMIALFENKLVTGNSN